MSQDESALKDFFQSATEAGRLSMKKYDREKLLSAIDVIHNGYINNGGYALFGVKVTMKCFITAFATVLLKRPYL